MFTYGKELEFHAMTILGASIQTKVFNHGIGNGVCMANNLRCQKW